MIFKLEAAQDIREAIEWYESQEKGLGERFRNALNKAFKRIEAMPEVSRMIYPGIRRVTTTGFPFVVYYCIDEGEIIVLAVVHSHSDPDRWKSRV